MASRCAALGPLARAVAFLMAVGSASAVAQDLGSDAQRASGKELYDKHCSQCHGENGDGQAHATLRVKPQPRDFTSGKYKFRTTPSGRLPTDEDIARVIRDGLPYTSMPGWPNFDESEIQDLVYYLKTFSEDFENPNMYAEPIEIPAPLEASDGSIARGREIYEQLGCAACHGDHGRGDGNSAPTLTDDWGQHIRPADLTQPWTFRGGATKRDVFRTFTTGLNGTPMPSYADSLEVEDRLHLVNYIASLSEGIEPDYDSLVVATYVEGELEVVPESEEEGAPADLFADAPKARFPLLGQIVEPGRNFYPSTSSVDVQAVYNRREIAIRVSWHDMRAETAGTNGPTLEVPVWEEQLAEAGVSTDEGASDDSFFGEAEGDDFWGGAEQEPVSDDDFFGDLEQEEEGDDFWGEEAEEGDDFWGESGDQAGGATTADTEFSDAVAIQFPSVLPSGNRKPYFIFGDSQSRVDLWFLDLGRGIAEVFNGRGSEQLEPSEADIVEAISSYEAGEWSVVFKRQLRSGGGINFEQDQYTPIAFSVWDGFNRERGNKRALSSWVYLYTAPAEKVSAVGPMIRVALLVLIAELLLVFFIRRRAAAGRAVEQRSALAQGGVTS